MRGSKHTTATQQINKQPSKTIGPNSVPTRSVSLDPGFVLHLSFEPLDQQKNVFTRVARDFAKRCEFSAENSSNGAILFFQLVPRRDSPNGRLEMFTWGACFAPFSSRTCQNTTNTEIVTFVLQIGPVSRVAPVELEALAFTKQIRMTNHRLLGPRGRNRISFGRPKIGNCVAIFFSLVIWWDPPNGQFEHLKGGLFRTMKRDHHQAIPNHM